MKITDKGEIVFDLQDFLDRMDSEIKNDLVKTLACQDSIIKDVADQIIDGWTEEGSSAGRAASPRDVPRWALDVAIRRISKASSEIARVEIERLEGAVRRLEDANRNLNLNLQEYHNRYR